MRAFRPFALAGAAGLVFVAAGCTTPTEKPKAGPFADTFAETDTLPAADPSAWWRAFEDPLLDQVVEEAFAQNITLQQAMLRVKESRALAHQTLTSVLPSLSAQGDVRSTEVLDGPGLFGSLNSIFDPATPGGAFVTEDRQVTGTYGPAVTWEVPFFGQIQAAAVGYKGTVRQATAAARGARVTLAADAAQAYVDLRTAQTRAALLTQAADALEKIRASNKLQVDAGILASGDYARAESAAAGAKARAEVAQSVVRRALDRLAVLRGMAPGTDPLEQKLAEPQGLPSFKAGAPKAVPADLLRLRPDIAQAEAATLIAAAEVGVARNALLPQLTLTGSINIADNIVGSAYSENQTQAVMGAGINMPLFDWGERFAAVKAKKTRFKSALLGYRDTVNNAVAEAQGALSAFVRTDRAAELSRVSEAAAIRRDTAAAALYRVGISNLNDRLDAQNDLITARLDRATAEADASAAAITVYRAFGGGAQPPLMKTAAK